jgi:hypothetical protein
MYYKNILTLLVALFLTIKVNAQCNNTVMYHTFRSNWNDKVNVIKDGTWKLPEIDFKKIKRDSFEMIHPLVQEGISFKATINKNGCISKAAIRGKIDDSLNVQGSLAMLYMIDLFNHELNNKERQKAFDDLKNRIIRQKSSCLKNNW